MNLIGKKQDKINEIVKKLNNNTFNNNFVAIGYFLYDKIDVGIKNLAYTKCHIKNTKLVITEIGKIHVEYPKQYNGIIFICFYDF